MSFEADFLSTMSSTVTIKPATTDSGYGDPSFGTPVASPAHITIANKIVRTDREEVANSTAQIQIPPPGYVWGAVTIPAVGVADHILMPDGSDRRVLEVTVRYDDKGAHHQTLALT